MRTLLKLESKPLVKKSIRYIAVFSIIFLMGCEDNLPNYYNTREYNLNGFTEISLGSNLQVEIHRDDEFRVFANGENVDIADLDLKVSNKVLTGHYTRNRRNRKRTLVQIYLPVLTGASLGGATTTIIRGFNAEENNLKLHVSGASELNMESFWKIADIDITGNSFLRLNGHAEEVNARVSGSSKLNSLQFSSNKITIAVEGNSDAAVKVYQNLSGTVNGRSRLSYSGSPGTVEVQVSGESELRRLVILII